MKQAVLDAVDKLDCDVCKRIQRPKTIRDAALKRDIDFNEAVTIDEAEVVLSDGFRVMVLVVADEASGFRMIIPTKAVRSISGKEAKELFYRGWCSWAGCPETLVYDPAAGQLVSEFANPGDDNDITMRPVPAESPQLKSKVERSIDFFKDHFVRVDKQVGLTRHDDPHVWCSHIAFACNTHFRKSGFSPYMFVLGHAPKVPTSLTESFLGDQRRLAAHSSVLFDKGPRRAEQIRAAANRAFFDMDTDEQTRKALTGRVRPSRDTFKPGQLVYFYRAATVKKAMGRRLQSSIGWNGPCIVLALEGPEAYQRWRCRNS